MEKKLLSNLRRLSVCLLLPFIALQARAQASTVANVTDGYYNILTNDGKYVNVAGRKTVNFVNESAAKTKAGTIIRVKTNDKGQVEILRSQGVDVPGYADRAINYVPKIVQLVVDKLHAEGSGAILGTDGLDAIMKKFDESFDYHLYLESAGSNSYRIYGKTPSMQPVVDFYKDNKAKVDAKLPKLEQFINDAIQKVLDKTGGRGASILVPFSLETVWQNMGGALTKPKKGNDEAIAKFYEEVLTNKDNVWNFAYQTAMIYWGNLKKHPRYETDIKPKLGEYAKYIDKVENIRPDFKYYIVPGTSTLDIISQGNTKINDPSTAWTLQECTKFNVNFPETNKKGDKYYTTLYTDFAYTLPEGVTAMKVTAVSEAGVAKTEEITGTIPAQTPILLVSTVAGDQTLAPTTSAGSAVTGNLLKGPDYLINTYGIKTAQVESLFNFAKEMFGESFYNNNIAKYEHLTARNAGTVNNKYFFGLTEYDLYHCNSSGNENDCVVRSLDVDENNKLAFSDRWTVAANKAFLVSEEHDVIKLFLKGDINMDGKVDSADIVRLVDYILERESTVPCDVDACDVNEDGKIVVADVTSLVDIILNQ